MYFGRPSTIARIARIAKPLYDESVSTSNAPAQTGLAPTRPRPAKIEAPKPQIRSRFRQPFYSLELRHCAAGCLWKTARPVNLPCILPAPTIEQWQSQHGFATLADRLPSVQFRRELVRFPARHPKCLSLFRCAREGHREVFARWPAHSSIAPPDRTNSLVTSSPD